MITFLHTFRPSPIALSIGNTINIHWYGLLIVIGMIIALLLSLYLAKKHKINRETIFDLSFWLIIGGLLGARLYDVFLELPYYLNHPLQIFQIWKGGLAIHGAIISGLIITYFYTKNKKINFWKLTAIFMPGLIFAQAIGRWGNYFNQEIFGLPTNLPWGIPIDLINRPINYSSFQYFHPVFLYESIGCLIIGCFLLLLNHCIIKRDLDQNNLFYILTISFYLGGYSVLRFFLEFIRLDKTPVFLGFRWPQVISLTICLICIFLIFTYRHANNKKK